MSEFKPFPKISRLSREIIITEKLDGTSAQVFIPEADEAQYYARKVMAGSRNRWIEPEDDNYGFATWVAQHYEELLQLGPGRHFGEWWGGKIGRGYGLKEKKFSLFNATRWGENRPSCCDVVPIVTSGLFCDETINKAMQILKDGGSLAAPGFMNPEGIIIFHTQNSVLFKKTFDKDNTGKEI